MGLAKGLSIVFIFSKNQLLVLLIFAIVFFVSFSSISALSFMISFLLLTLKVKVKSLSCVQLFVTPWNVAHQAPPSMEFSRQEYWSGLPFPSPRDLPESGIEPGSPA